MVTGGGDFTASARTSAVDGAGSTRGAAVVVVAVIVAGAAGGAGVAVAVGTWTVLALIVTLVAPRELGRVRRMSGTAIPAATATKATDASHVRRVPRTRALGVVVWLFIARGRWTGESRIVSCAPLAPLGGAPRGETPASTNGSGCVVLRTTAGTSLAIVLSVARGGEWGATAAEAAMWPSVWRTPSTGIGARDRSARRDSTEPSSFAVSAGRDGSVESGSVSWAAM